MILRDLELECLRVHATLNIHKTLLLYVIMSAAGEMFLSSIDSQGDDDDDDDDIAIFLVRILGPLSPNGFPVRIGDPKSDIIARIRF